MISTSEVASLRFDAIKKAMRAAKGIAGRLEAPVPGRRPLQLSRSVLDYQGPLPLSSPSLLTLGRGVKAGTNQAPPTPLSPAPNKQIRSASLETDAKTLAHASVSKQNQADLRLNTTVVHTPVCKSTRNATAAGQGGVDCFKGVSNNWKNI